MVQAIRWAEFSRIVILTGAGISVASGLRPYRGPGGLWEEADGAAVADSQALHTRPEEVWSFFARARRSVHAAQPNPAHLAITALQERLRPGQSLQVITQNVDGLHQRAGTRDVVELHGSLSRSRCVDPGCSLAPFPDDNDVPEPCPTCPACGGFLRPDVVLFGEMLPPEAEWKSKRALRDCDLFLAVGTSGTVYPAAGFVRAAAYAGARTVLVNLLPMSPPDPSFHTEILGRAEELLPQLLAP